MFTQLNPPLPLHVLGKGSGHAIGMIDYGAEHHLVWVTAIAETGEIWCAPNPQVRMQSNWTLGRDASPAVKAERAHEMTGEAAPCEDCAELMTLKT